MATFVSARLLSGFLRHLAVQRIDVDALVGDLPIGVHDTEGRTALVDWEDVAELGVRLERHVGGADGLEDLGAAMVSSRPMPAIRRLVGWTAAPSVVYRIGLRWLELHMPRDFSTRIEATEDGRLAIRVLMPDAPRSCRPLVHMLAGAARGLPTVVDLSEAMVETRLDADSATFLVTPPSSGSLWGRMRRGVRTLLGSNDALEDLEEERHLLRRHVDHLEGALFDAGEREANLRTLVEASDEVLLLVDRKGRIHSASESARHITGYAPEQIIGSHLTLWFHRDHDAPIRGLLQRAFASDETGGAEMLRARHERGHWIDAQIDTRRPPSDATPDRIVISIREPVRAGATPNEARALTARLKSLERRHHDLREMHAKLIEAERVAATREVAEFLEASIRTSLRPLVEGLDVVAHMRGSENAALFELCDLAQRIESGLERTLATLRRAKQERSIHMAPALAHGFEATLRSRLQGFAIGIHVDADEMHAQSRVWVDGDLVNAAFEHVTEHIARSARIGGHIEVQIRHAPAERELRITVRGGRDCAVREIPQILPIDLELARGLYRAQGGDISIVEEGLESPELVLSLPLDTRG